MSKAPAPQLTLVQEAEQARQVVNVLARLETRIAEGRWARGFRVGPDNGNCLIGAVDEATRWVLPGVAERVTAELVDRLPAPLRAVGRVRPRLALATYNDTVGGREGALDLVRRTRYALGGLPLVTFAGEPRATPWVAGRQRVAEPTPVPSTAAPAPVASAPVPAGPATADRVIDVTDRWVARQPLRR
jgi:hypothetical protein